MRTINYHGGQRIYDTEQVDGMLMERDEAIRGAAEETERSMELLKGMVEGLSLPVGETMYWGRHERVRRTVRSDRPFTFTVFGKERTVDVPDAEVELCVAADVPEGWHALDGTAELDAEEHRDLADFFGGRNTTADGKVWLPYVSRKIIKVRFNAKEVRT